MKVRMYDEQQEGNVATFDEVQSVVIETASGTFRLREVGGVLQLLAYHGVFVIHPRASNLIRLEVIP